MKGELGLPEQLKDFFCYKWKLGNAAACYQAEFIMKLKVDSTLCQIIKTARI